ncbi:hypothetical protein ABTW96_04115 [Nocardia beijingensis]|uniref:hypothetical protein n=1 Tax=Nocardia beijingensis TaxID=95162 RepID=UPI00332185B0
MVISWRGDEVESLVAALPALKRLAELESKDREGPSGDRAAGRRGRAGAFPGARAEARPLVPALMFIALVVAAVADLGAPLITSGHARQTESSS